MKRKNRVSVMLSDEELQKLDQRVEKEGVSRSDVIRKLIDRCQLETPPLPNPHLGTGGGLGVATLVQL
ncbi:ribbon-helix-helix domain-containing protein [Lyngbya sp. CCY1209]|jgi:metal-responsive CopG/Arc/MetJ family transcriptional regulator|uniref:ribbon-helix-helix domain-containing protein n=1 Tax=Lyngbya sp. CCY1209 TaxID=2886103 RepID=UPI002D212594|nr:ribbon-helix-helix domain-containing protein [Lyngbya sp. CCY1209]